MGPLVGDAITAAVGCLEGDVVRALVGLFDGNALEAAVGDLVGDALIDADGFEGDTDGASDDTNEFWTGFGLKKIDGPREGVGSCCFVGPKDG